MSVKDSSMERTNVEVSKMKSICRRLFCMRFSSSGRLQFNRISLLALVAYLLLVQLLLAHLWRSTYKIHSMEIRLPQAALSSQTPGAYLCTAISLRDPRNASAIRPIYIVEFEPLVPPNPTNSEIHVHHMLLAECNELPEGVGVNGHGWWNCGLGHHKDSAKSANSSKEMCSVRQRYLFAYSNSAEAFRLPRKVAMPVGDSRFYGGAHLVLQVHYSSGNQRLHVHPNQHHSPAVGDRRPGLRLRYLNETGNHYRVAGVHLSSTSIRPDVRSRHTTGCEYTGELPIRPFGLRVHTHSLGRLVSVYRVRRPRLPQDPMVWHLIGQADPRQPQAYYSANASSDLTVKPGDLIATACATTGGRGGRSAPVETCNAWLIFWFEQLDALSKVTGPDGHEGKVDLRQDCISSGSALSLWSDAPKWVEKQAFLV
ncbi:hypothetical protein BOX15_Mlig031046g2 [Macrostomum lignano]|uniref:Peptidylglycine monooxygenase n=2 Tax=Macrostomum lignano TaxID=282301 RepID=A0A1I8G3J8_9PLAT|nr:hypothetical protein BOX15_Mlig031046g2 [Macrostomum lignano]